MITLTKVCALSLNFFLHFLFTFSFLEFVLGFGQWPMSGNQTTDEVFMSAQDAVGAQRDTQGKNHYRY